MLLKTSTHHQSDKAGYPPGTVVYVGKEREGDARITRVSFGEAEEVSTEEDLPLAEVAPRYAPEAITWLNIDGVHQPEVIQAVGTAFGLHPLTQEDIANTEQRPKAEDFETYLYVLLKMISFDPETSHIHIEQVSLVLTEDHVLTFQEAAADVFDPLRERLKVPGSRLRRYEADYFFFALIDVVISNYFYVVEHLNDRLTQLELDIIDVIDQEALTDMQQIRKSLQALQRAINPLREAMTYCLRGESKLIDKRTRVYFQELSDQVHQVIDAISSQQDSLNNLQSLYLALASQKTNDVMKGLTVISIIFLPLSFLAGVYGMNFDHQPELHWHYSYYVFWGGIITMVIGMLIYFRYKDWI
jgi:magnesium transporter